MSVIEVFCEDCKAVRPHAAGDDVIVCTGCGLVREADGEQLAAVMAFAEGPPVEDMRDCGWCNAKKPVGRDCPAGAVGCTARQPDETPCGTCGACYAAQRQDLIRYGTPTDLDIP